MLDNIVSTLANWNMRTTERQKLQHTYLAATFVTVMIAGITSLISADTGHAIVLVALAAIIVFAINAIIWTLLYGALIVKLPGRARRR